MSMKGHGIAVAVIMKNGEVIEEEFSFDNEEWVRLSCKPGLFQNMDTMEEFHDNFFSAFEPGFDGYDDDEYTFAELMEDVGDIDSFEDMMQTLEGYTPDDIVQIILLTDFEDDGYRTYDWQKFSMKPYGVTNGTAKADMAENSGWSVKYSPTVHEFIRAEFIKPQKAVARKKTIRTHDEEPAKTFEKKGNQVMMHAAKNGYAVVNNDWAIKLPDNWVWTTDPEMTGGRPFWGLDSAEFHEFGPSFQYTENCFVVVRQDCASINQVQHMLDDDAEKIVTKSGITIIFNCKMDSPSMIFIETRSALYSAGFNGGFNENGIYWSFSKKLNEIRKLLNTIHYVGEEPAMGSFSGGDPTAFAKATEALNDVTEQFAQGQAGVEKYSNYLEQKEAREKAAEEERAKKKAAAIAAGKNEDDIVNMYIILTNEKKIGKLRRSQEDFYKTYEDDFLTLSKAGVIKARKDMLAEMEDASLCAYYAEKFKQRSVKDRFDISTKNLKAVAQMPDTDFGAEWAIENTGEWYEESELPEVRRLMDANLAKGKKDLDEQLDTVESAWKKYSTGKKFLKITVSDKNADGVEIREDCSGFQVVIGSALVEVQLSTKGVFRMATPVMNCFPWYWGVSAKDIWEAALKNEVSDDRKGAYDGKQLADKALAQIKSKYSAQKTASVAKKETCKKETAKKSVLAPLSYDNGTMMPMPNNLRIPVPDGYHCDDNGSGVNSGWACIVPENADLSENHIDAKPYGFGVVTAPSSSWEGAAFESRILEAMKEMLLSQGVLDSSAPVDSLIISDRCAILYQNGRDLSEGLFNKVRGFIFAGSEVRMFHIIVNHDKNIGGNEKTISAFLEIAQEWMRRIVYGTDAEVGGAIKTSAVAAEKLPEEKSCSAASSAVSSVAEFEIEGTCLKKYNGTEKHVIIPDGVTKIDKRAFFNCGTIEKIDLPESLKEIANEAFRGCKSLQFMKIPDGVEVIPRGAFYKCEELKAVDLPESVTSIGSEAFYECRKLEKVSIPAGVKSLGKRVFSRCGTLSEVALPDGVQAIDDETFAWCTSLQQFVIPDSVEQIGRGAFNGCEKLKELIIPKNVRTIGHEFLQWNDELESIIFTEGIEEISIIQKEADDCLLGCLGGNEKRVVISLPKSLKRINPENRFATLLGKKDIKKLIVYKGTYSEEFAKRSGLEYELILTEEQRREEEERKIREEEARRRLEEERRRKAEEDRIRLEEERRRFEEARKIREEEERKIREAEERRRQERLEAARKEYDQLKEDINLQMQIISQNKGWFGAAAKARKAAQVRLEALQARMARDFPAGRP